MNTKKITPILNVSDIQESFRWFAQLGWQKAWDWGEPPSFGGVCSGDVEIFLCENGQGGRGKSAYSATFGPNSDEAAEQAVWMALWVEDVDAVHQHCLQAGIEITFPPTTMSWNVREMHIRHPDGHVFRVSQGLEE